MRIAIPVPPEKADGLYGNYFATMRALGAEPFAAASNCNPSECDGLLLPGGVDVDPSYYGQSNVACGEIDRPLDALQLAVLDGFVRAKKPILGVCRGHQMVNIYFRGTLIQHLPDRLNHSRDPGSGIDKAHLTIAEPGCWLSGLYGERFSVNSAHHQAVDRLGEGLVIDQRSPDGVVEGMHHGSLPIWCVQWHPERMCLERARMDTVDGCRTLKFFLKLCAEQEQR